MSRIQASNGAQTPSMTHRRFCWNKIASLPEIIQKGEPSTVLGRQDQLLEINLVGKNGRCDRGTTTYEPTLRRCPRILKERSWNNLCDLFRVKSEQHTRVPRILHDGQWSHICGPLVPGVQTLACTVMLGHMGL